MKQKIKFRFHVLCNILFFTLLATRLPAQAVVELSFSESVDMLKQQNQSIKIAEKGVEWAESERQKMNALWYPTVNATGAYVHLSNPVEVKEPLNRFTDPAKDFVQSIIPDDQIISAILDKVGTYTLKFPLFPQNLTTIDANIMWPVFAGGKRIYAGHIGRSMVSLAEENRGQVDASMQVLLVDSYFGLRLRQRVVDVRQQAYNSLEKHYQNALKLEAAGMINKAERLFVQVNMDEAKRELESARSDVGVANSALKALIKMDTQQDIRPVSSLFINDTLLPVAHFRSLVEDNNYILNQLELQEQIADNQLKISNSAYLPEVAMFGKQTLYAHGISKNLLPRSMVGVGLTWNLFDGLAREKKINQAKISRQTVDLTRKKATDDLMVGIDKLYSQMQSALNSVTALNTTIEMSNELVRMRNKAFAEGMATSTEVVDAEVMLSKVQIALLLAYYQYDVALINLLAICGVPDTFGQYSVTGRNEHYIFKP